MMFISKRLEFKNDQNQTLQAKLEMPFGDPQAYAIFAHCFTCSKDILAASRISRKLAELGIATLRFDFTGLGNSEGDFANTSFQSNIQDLIQAAKHLSQHFEAPSILIGHSLGGTAVLAAANEIKSIQAVIAIAAPSEPTHVEKYLEKKPDGTTYFHLGKKPFILRPQFLEDLRNQKMKNRLKTYTKSTLIFHSPIDTIVGINHARVLFDLLPYPKSFVSLDGADHLLSKREDSSYVAEVISSWITKHIQLKHPSDVSGVRVVEIDQSLTQKIYTGSHQIIADEPQNLGGRNLGPNPYDFLLSSLGACTSMTLRMYAKHKKWPLEGIQIELSHKKIHAQDCKDCETVSGKIDHIHKKISLLGPLTPEQKTRLLEIADKCPVHRTLHSENKIVSELSEP